MDSQANLNLEKLKLLSLGNAAVATANEPTSLFMNLIESDEEFCDIGSEEPENEEVFFSDPEVDVDCFSEIGDTAEDQCFEDFKVSSEVPSHVSDASGSDDQTYNDGSDCWAPLLDSVKDICDYDSDTGICEY